MRHGFKMFPALCWVGIVLSGCAVASTSTSTPPTSEPTQLAPTLVEPTATVAAEKPFRIIGYVGAGDTIVSQIQFDKLTHINYAFLLPNPDGTFVNIVNAWKLDDVVEEAHAHGVKVLISVGGWGYDEQFEQLAADATTRSRFVSELDRFVEQYNLDGADIDWEYPGPEAESARNFVALIDELSAVLHPKGKLLTAAVVAAGRTGDDILPETFDMFDFINVMAYDGPDTNHSSYRYAEESLDYWSGRGLSADKLVLGVPFYARPSEATYRKLVEADPNAAQSDQIDYLGGAVYYNGIPTMQQKTELALQRASGIMIWALAHDTQDDTSLLSAIYHAAYGEN